MLYLAFDNPYEFRQYDGGYWLPQGADTAPKLLHGETMTPTLRDRLGMFGGQPAPRRSRVRT